LFKKNTSYLYKKIVLKKKKPDAIVWDEEHETYFAKLLPYASSLSGPIIEVPNVDAFKKKGVDKVSKQFQAELSELQQKIKSFVSLAADTQQVYSAHFKFEPIVGETYHLYQGKNQTFLSLIEPSHWNKKHLGSFRLNAEYKWERL
jgi:vacuolar-type H+-ATPase subunit I/STV1